MKDKEDTRQAAGTEDMRMYGIVTQALIEAFELKCLPMQAVTFAHGKYETATARIAELEAKNEELYDRAEWLRGQREIEVRQKNNALSEAGTALKDLETVRAENAQLKAKLAEG